MILELLILAHSWYPADCCSGEDCRPVPASDLRELDKGEWLYIPLALVYQKRQVFPSQDSNYHVCYTRWWPKASLCLFIVQGA